MSTIEITLPPPPPKCANGPCTNHLGDGEFCTFKINTTLLLFCLPCGEQLKAVLEGPKNKQEIELTRNPEERQ